MEIRNAIIKNARITMGGHGVLTAWLDLAYDGEGQGFGGYVLYLPEGYKYHSVWGTAGHFIYRVLQIADVDRWDQLPGKTIRVKQDYCAVHAIGHIVNDDWFCPKEDFEGVEYSDVAITKKNWTSAEVDVLIASWKKAADQWQAIAEKLAEYLEIQCSLLPYYDGKQAGDFIDQAKKELGYE